MSIMDFFSSQGTAEPMPGSERGDWIDWFLNREGPAGRFKGSRRPRYGIDYLFNGGGSVRSKPRSRPGPKTRQKLQPRSPDVLGNVSDRYYREGNVEGMRRIGQEMQDRLQNSPTLRPGTGSIFPGEKRGEQNPYSFWNASLPQQTGDNSRIMRANNQQGNGINWLNAYNIYDEPENNSGIMELENNYNIEEYSPDGHGRWMTQSPYGNKLLSYLVNQFASDGSSEYLQDAIGGGGIPLGILGYKGYIRPTWEDDNYGFMWSSGG